MTLINDGSEGEVVLTMVDFEQDQDYLITVPSGEHEVTLDILVPMGLLEGTYPILVQLDNQELRPETTIEGATCSPNRLFGREQEKGTGYATETMDIKLPTPLAQTASFASDSPYRWC